MQVTRTINVTRIFAATKRQKSSSTSRRSGHCFLNSKEEAVFHEVIKPDENANMRSNFVPGLSLVILVINVPCFSEGLKCYTCVSHTSWEECERKLKTANCPAPDDEVCVKELLVEPDNNSEEGSKKTFSKFCAMAESCKDTHCKETGKICDPKCCHTDLCNTAATIQPSRAAFVICVLLVNFAVMFK